MTAGQVDVYNTMRQAHGAITTTAEGDGLWMGYKNKKSGRWCENQESLVLPDGRIICRRWTIEQGGKTYKIRLMPDTDDIFVDIFD